MDEWPPHVGLAGQIIVFLELFIYQLLISFLIYGLVTCSVLIFGKNANYRFPFPLAASLGAFLCPLPLFLALGVMFSFRKGFLFGWFVLGFHLFSSFIMTLGAIFTFLLYRRYFLQNKTTKSDLVFSGYILLASSAAYLFGAINIAEDTGPL